MTTSRTDDGGSPPRPFAGRRPAIARWAVHALRRWKTPRLANYAPRSTLELPDHSVSRARVTAVDFHTHLGRWLTPDGGWMEPDVGRVLAEMDAANVSTLVNLDGRWGGELEDNLDRYDRAHPGRFVTFCHVDWRRLEERAGPELLVDSLRRSVASGARGLKVWKDLGLGVTVHGRQLLPDDRLVAPIWEAAGELGVPVLAHVADPMAFFLPADRHNERLEQIRRYPHGTRHAGGRVAFKRLLDAFEQVVATHPRTNFVAAHAFHPENLAHVTGMIERYPNFFIDVAAVAGQLGRQPRAAREVMARYPDRVLFGTDIFPMHAQARAAYFRLLETDDECFPYSDDPVPPFGRWAIYGLNLPTEVLEQVYRDNAQRLLALPVAPTSADDRTRRP